MLKRFFVEVELSAYIRIFAVVLVCAAMGMVTGCGGNSSSSTPAPAPTSPTNPSGNLPSTNPGINPNVSQFDLRKQFTWAVTLPVNAQGIDYSGLQDLIGTSKFLSLPMVVQPQFSAIFDDKTNNTQTTSEFFLYYEDQSGLHGAILPSVAKLAVRDATNYDFSYGDDAFSIRVLMTKTTANEFQGGVYYRVRQSGETQCNKVITSCTYDAATCDWLVYQEALACRNYLDTSLSQVKLLGTFSGVPYSRWAAK